MNTSLTSATGAPAVGQQSKLVLYGALVFFAIGALQLMFSGPLWGLWISATTLAVAGGLGLLRLMLVPSFSTPWSVLAVSLSLGYGFGTFNTMVSGYAEGMNFLAVSYSSYDTLSRVIGGLLVLVAMMFTLGEMDPGKLVPVKPLTDTERSSVTVVLVFAVLATVVAVGTGSLGFQSSMAAEEGSARVSVLGALVVVVMAPILATAVFAHATESGSSTRVLVFALCAVLMMVLMLQGRRIFMYSILVAVIAFFAARGTSKFFTLKTGVLLVSLAALVLTTSKFYFALRMASWNLGKHGDLGELLASGLDIFLNANHEGLDDRVAENQSTRTFIIGYLAEIVDGVESHRFVGGGLLELGLATAVPTTIWPGKWRILSQGSEEAICHPVVGLPGWDGANTIVSAGVCDFGWYGFFIYPLVLAAFFSLVVFALRGVNPVVRMLVCFGIVGGLLGVETVIAGYFVLIRNLFILGLGAWGLVTVVHWFEARRAIWRGPPMVKPPGA